METTPQTFSINELTFRPPVRQDGHTIYQLIRHCPPLDVNSSYAYFLLADHFSSTCVVAEKENVMVGFLSAYIKPEAPDTLFVWQIAVSEKARGLGLASHMLNELAMRDACDQVMEIQTTIGPDNVASQKTLRRFAHAWQLQEQKESFLTASDFSGESHEDEDLYRFSVPNGQTLAMLRPD